MKNILKTFALSLLFISAFSCKKDSDKNEKETVTKKPVAENYNISILLDLSDRISLEKNPNPTMEYYQRDLGYIKSVSDAFTQHLKSKRIRQIDDKMQLFFNPEPKDPEINSISQKLKIAIDKNNASKDLLNSINSNYAARTSKIYESALEDNNFIGSDIWSFFDTKVKDQCIETGDRNILVILTDGYMYYDSTIMKEANRTTFITPDFIRKNGLNTKDWEKKFQNGDFGFIRAGDDLSKLEVLVLGINPAKSNPYEEKVIKAYWTKWFSEMKVKHFEIKNADLPSNMEKIIRDFIVQNH
ncbi:hypothetical protein D0809_07900 [Flavobacterium circumlabens]|uniref:VWA domain-containing protein n=1 Tax=Flavobacterium circumlabens TaxID=2133765 RepID=A0A4Y7UFV3_9FLAO|nr:hypothetical protein [Flavobacterium circumlabens]TCN59835.1 hypothetical protein EV142_102455 [Flavobacterium circumlabens]TEB45091.1 hypothetical protein D0809_07900 [Flavobacterium circumlabens]